MVKQILVTTLAALLVAIPAASLAGKISEGEVVYHTIVKGDTLWDLSETYFEDPFNWPNLWKRNPYIKNPHLIYPGDVVKITTDGIELVKRRGEPGGVPTGVPTGTPVIKILAPPSAAVEEEVSAELVVEAPPPIKMIRLHNIQRDGFISTKEAESSGTIVSSKDLKENLVKNDSLFIAFKDPASVKVGDRFSAYTVLEEVSHPVTDKPVGSLISIHGSLVITHRHEDVFEGRIDSSFKEIEVGTMLIAYRAPETEVQVFEAQGDAPVAGVILIANDGVLEISEGDIVYIDKGEGDGVASGNIMDISRTRKGVKNPHNKKKRSVKKDTLALPPEELGSLIVIEANDETSSAIVIKGHQPIYSGDTVRLRQAAE